MIKTKIMVQWPNEENLLMPTVFQVPKLGQANKDMRLFYLSPRDFYETVRNF